LTRPGTRGDFALGQPTTGAGGKHAVRCRLSIYSEAHLGYRIARFRGRRQLKCLQTTAGAYAAGTGNAVTDLIFSIANREVTFFRGTALISFL
jgi:hypothetical protein